MSLSFIYGPAGAGKSSFIQDQLIQRADAEPGRNFLLIVPDQFTMQTQSDIVRRHPRQGIMNVDVLSFGRLSHRIFEEVGKPKEKVLDDTGKSLVIRHVASSVSDSMPYIGKNLQKVGYVHEVKSAISEFMQYGVGVDALKNLKIREQDSLLRTKLSDLSVIYEAFQKYNLDKFITGEESLDILCKKLPLSQTVKDAVIVFDGFTGFTPIQERVIGTLMTLAQEVIVTLTLSDGVVPGKTVGEENLFHLSAKTANRLISMAADLKVPRGEDTGVGEDKLPRFEAGSGLAHLEKSIFRNPVVPCAGPGNDIEFFEAENIRTEVEETALRILKLIRQEGYAYRDIAVVTGDLENYGDLFDRRLAELQIPHFIDRTNSIVLNPFTEYLKSALRILIKDYSYDTVFHYLKSGFTDLTEDETDRLDIYIRSLNIRGKNAWHREFKRHRKGMSVHTEEQKALAEADRAAREETRKKFIDTMESLEQPAETAGDYVKNLYAFLTANHSYEKLMNYADSFEREEDQVRAGEYRQIYRLIMQLLDTIVSLVGDEKMSAEEFYRIFEAGIGEINVGTIPQGVDRILVGDIERTRLKEVKALFFLGINDGNIPKNKDSGGILSSRDREVLKEIHMELAPTPREEMYSQRLYLYMNMCKPTKKLILSYADTDREGKSLRPAYLVGVLENMLGKKAEKVKEQAEISRIASMRDSFRQFADLSRGMAAGTLSEEEKDLAGALLKLYRDSDADKIYERELDAAFYEYEDQALPREIIDKLYGMTISATISRMETFAQCAYAHFLKFGMGMTEEAENEIGAADMGTVYHGVLNLFSERLEAMGLTWRDFSDEQGKELLADCVTDFVADYEQGILLDDAARQYTIIKITHLLERTIETLRFQAQRGKFLPKGFEKRFTHEIRVDEDHTININGKVDRIDIYEKDNDIYVKILDYKSSAHDIDISEVYYGIQQQLGLYLYEAMRVEQETHPEATVHPAAMLYYAIADPLIATDGKEDDGKVLDKIHKELLLKGFTEGSEETLTALDEKIHDDSRVVPVKYKNDGTLDSNSQKKVFTEDELRNFVSYTERMTERIAREVCDGNISISPVKSENKDACTYCAFAGICKFDEKMPGFEGRECKDKTEEEIRSAVMEGDENGDYLFRRSKESN